MQTGRRGRPNRQPREGDRGNDLRGGRGGSRGRGRGEESGSARGFSSPRGPFRGRGTFHNRQPRNPDFPPVPSYASITPGHGVSIILKEDQPTGHQVKGIVADLLTRGDHPRGVKVRLRDGRVGRVQGLVSESEGERGEALVGGPSANLGRNGEDSRAGVRTVGSGFARGGRMLGGRVERDIREEDEYIYEEGRRAPAEVGLFAALEEADRRHQQRSEETGDVTTCPVCGEFEGDEAAVAHHVEGHFGD
jgi:uncharacterized repeat protein (TIGR03833 family)